MVGGHLQETFYKLSCLVDGWFEVDRGRGGDFLRLRFEVKSPNGRCVWCYGLVLEKWRFQTVGAYLRASFSYNFPKTVCPTLFMNLVA